MSCSRVRGFEFTAKEGAVKIDDQILSAVTEVLGEHTPLDCFCSNTETTVIFSKMAQGTRLTEEGDIHSITSPTRVFESDPETITYKTFGVYTYYHEPQSGDAETKDGREETRQLEINHSATNRYTDALNVYTSIKTTDDSTVQTFSPNPTSFQSRSPRR